MNVTIWIMSYKTKMARRIDISDKQKDELKKMVKIIQISCNFDGWINAWKN
jgi:hypothetical protein